MTLAVLLFGTANAQSAYIHPWMQKRVAYFGDSITDPRNSGSKKKYWHFLQEWLGIEPYVYAVSGRQWDDIPRQADKLQAEHGNNVDAILIFIGTNDYNNGVKIGEWYEEKDEQVMYGHGQPKKMTDRKRHYMSMDKNTYRGRINIALDKVKRMYPTKQIVLLTPIHRAGFYANEKELAMYGGLHKPVRHLFGRVYPSRQGSWQHLGRSRHRPECGERTIPHDGRARTILQKCRE